MSWCEANKVDYVFGLSRNARREARVAGALAEAAGLSDKTKAPARVFRDFMWATRGSWARRRRVIAKAECTHGKANPRFLVTSLKPDRFMARPLYETLYCARGEMENRIKECQLDLFADRTSAATMRANQLRLWFASFAYVLLSALRRLALRHTTFQTATCGTIRLKPLKIAAKVTVSVRRITVSRPPPFPGPTSCGSPAQGFSPPRPLLLEPLIRQGGHHRRTRPSAGSINPISADDDVCALPPLTSADHPHSALKRSSRPVSPSKTASLVRNPG